MRPIEKNQKTFTNICYIFNYIDKTTLWLLKKQVILEIRFISLQTYGSHPNSNTTRGNVEARLHITVV